MQGLYGRWMAGETQRYAVVAADSLQGTYGGQSAAREMLITLPDAVERAFVVPLWPLDGWRHPRFVVESYRRPGAPPPDVSGISDALIRDFLVAEVLRRDKPTPDELREPYLLIKDGALLARYKRVTQVRQAIAAAMPPLAPVVFTSLRPAHYGPFTLMVLQALVEGLPVGEL